MISIFFTGKNAIKDAIKAINATQPTDESALRFEYRLLNSEENEEKIPKKHQELKIKDEKEIEVETEGTSHELLSQPSTVKEKINKKHGRFML